MTTLSLFISLTSLALAAAMAVVLARIRRDERRRSDARVAALTQMAGPDFLSEHELAAPMSQLPLEPPADGFVEPTVGSSWGTRLAFAGALALVVLIVFAVMRSPSAAGTPPASVTLEAAQREAAPLELLALDHLQDGASLIVSGRVQNPRGAQPASSLTATVFLFGSDGTFLTSGRSPLDVRPLGAGDQSAFVVTIPVNGDVARYRVSFRDDTGRAVSHVDRRPPTPSAAKQ